jgi:glycosyltransferase involved in cell wall biosynthesis
LWDNHSTDNTIDIAKSMGCKVNTFGVPGVLDDRTYMELKNECWKKKHNGPETRDYVIIVDADEILGLPEWLEGGPNYPSIFKTSGWNVFSYEMPIIAWTEITYGHYEENYSKSVIFDPKRITDINYRIGAHVCSPKGDIVWSEKTLTLFHYRNVGGPERLIKRHEMYRERLSEENKTRGFGIHYTWSDEERIKEWESKYQKSKPLLQVTGS